MPFEPALGLNLLHDHDIPNKFVNVTGDTMTGTLTIPTIIGGTGTTSDLTLQTTSGVGATGADMHFLVGNNGATEAITILNSGNVGIGTTSPITTLDISKSVAASSVELRLENSALDGYAYLILHGGNTNNAGMWKNGPSSNVGAAGVGSFMVYQGDNAPIGFITNNAATPQMVITGAGNVGIGTTAPGMKLDILDNINGEGAIRYLNSNTGSGAYANFYIGQATVGSKYALVQYLNDGFSASGVNNPNQMNFYAAAGATNGMLFHNQAAAPIRFAVNGSELMRIQSNGNVGIGTTSPTNLLSLGGLVDRIIWTERMATAATASKNLTLRIGGAVVGGTDLGGGILTIAGGISTGTGTSSVLLQTCPAGSTGTADNTLATMLEVTGNKFSVFGVTAVVRPTALTPTGTYTLNTGDAGSDTEITLMRTRINELEAKLQSLGLIL